MRRIALAGLAVVLSASQAAAMSQCRGKDLLAELKERDPVLVQHIREEGARVANAEANLWRIERDGAAPSYLYATVHVTDPRITEVSQATAGALGAAKRVAVEVTNVNDQSLAEAMQQMADKVMFPETDSLGRYLTGEEQQALSRLALGLGSDSVMLDRMQPWFVGMMLAMPACEQQRLADGLLPLDGLIEQAGLDIGAEVVGLETIAEQLESMASMPFDAQLANLKLTLAMSETNEDLNETLITIYRERRIGEVWPLTVAMSGDKALAQTVIDEFQLRLIDERNLRMRDRALPLLAKGDAFIAVGALHLPGDKGLVALFREAGYTVTPVE